MKLNALPRNNVSEMIPTPNVPSHKQNSEMKRTQFVTLVKDGTASGAWDEVRQRLHSRDGAEILENSEAISSIISVENTPFDIYVELNRMCKRGCNILDPFTNEFIILHLDQFISLTGPSSLAQKMFQRNSSTMDEAALEIINKKAPHLLYDWWTIRKCLELSHDEMKEGDRDLSSKLFRMGIHQKIGCFMENLQENASNRGAVVDALSSCYKDFYYGEFMNLGLRADDARMCFLEFYRVLQSDFQELLTLKDVVVGLKLLHCALDYGEDKVYLEILRSLGPSSAVQISILGDLSLLKEHEAISKVLGIGALPEDQYLHPNNNDILFQRDERNLTVLNYLWIVGQPSFNSKNRIFSKRWERDASLQASRVESTMKCLSSFEEKFPGVTRHFIRAWSCLLNANRQTLHQDSLSPFTLRMMKQVMHRVAKDENRNPLHVACEYGLSWSAGLPMVYSSQGSCIELPDPRSGLKPFAIAAVGVGSDLDAVYELLRLSPTAIIS